MKCKKEKITNYYNKKLFNEVFDSFDIKIYPHISPKNVNLSSYKNLESMFLFLYILKMTKSFKFKSIIFTLNRFLEFNFVNLFSGFVLLFKYFYYFYFKK